MFGDPRQDPSIPPSFEDACRHGRASVVDSVSRSRNQTGVRRGGGASLGDNWENGRQRWRVRHLGNLVEPLTSSLASARAGAQVDCMWPGFSNVGAIECVREYKATRLPSSASCPLYLYKQTQDHRIPNIHVLSHRLSVEHPSSSPDKNKQDTSPTKLPHHLSST